MKKIELLGLGLALLLCGCARPINPTFDLSMVGAEGTESPLSQPETYSLAAPAESSSERVKLTTHTEREENLYLASDGETPLFFSSIQHTGLLFPEDTKIEVHMNRELDFQYSEKQGMAENYLAQAEQMYQASLESPDAAAFYEFSYYANDSVYRLDENVLSLATYYSCYLGGIHPENLQVALNYDLQTADRLSLGAVLTEEGRSAICPLVLEQLQALLGDSELFSDYEDVVSAKFGRAALDMQWDNWYFTKNSLVLFLNPYEISPYAAGVVSVEFKDDEFRTLVREEFRPIRESGNPLGAFLAGPAQELVGQDTAAETVTVRPGEVSFAILCRSPIYDVTLRYNLWAGEEPTAREILYRTTCLTAGEALLVELDSEDEISNLCICFDPGDGISRTLRFSPETLDSTKVYTFYETEEKP